MPVDKSERRIREMFGEISPRYDFLNHFLSGGTDYYWRWRTVCRAAPLGDLPILDVCTGTGDLAVAYWRRGGGRIRVVGADFTHEMLTLARQKTARLDAGAPPIEFVEADAQRLPFADDRFQIVSVAFGLRNVTQTLEGLKEMARVCAGGAGGGARILDALECRPRQRLSLVLPPRPPADRTTRLGGQTVGV